MFTLPGPTSRYCDGQSRRSFLKVGSLALGAWGLPQLNLADVLAAEEKPGKRRTNKSVIMVYLSGGMAHQDTFDLKPDAPAEVRGEFKPIDTNLPGVQICELLPETAKIMDKLAVIRSIVGLRDEHTSFQNLTGYPQSQAQREGRPNIGSIISRVQGNTDPVTPAFVDLFPTMQHKPYNSPGPGYLGRGLAGVTADGEDLASMKPRYFTPGQLADRRRLLDQFDRFRRAVDQDESLGMDTAYARAFDVLSSSKLVEALNLDKEDPLLRDRYGRGSSKHQGDGAPLWNDQLLMARRLVEAGVRCVTVAYGFWDTHGQNFKSLRNNLPQFDKGISSLVRDLHDRGLAKDVTLCVWGEFGRTPKINKDVGRDHWAPVNGCLFAGGGLKTGQVIGSTDKLGGAAQDRPVNYLDVLATVYDRMGIDPHTFVKDLSDRPVPILPESARVIRELY